MAKWRPVRPHSFPVRTRVVLARRICHDAPDALDQVDGGLGVILNEMGFGGKPTGVGTDNLRAVPAFNVLGSQGEIVVPCCS